MLKTIIDFWVTFFKNPYTRGAFFLIVMLSTWVFGIANLRREFWMTHNHFDPTFYTVNKDVQRIKMVLTSILT